MLKKIKCHNKRGKSTETAKWDPNAICGRFLGYTDMKDGKVGFLCDKCKCFVEVNFQDGKAKQFSYIKKDLELEDIQPEIGSYLSISS